MAHDRGGLTQPNSRSKVLAVALASALCSAAVLAPSRGLAQQDTGPPAASEAEPARNFLNLRVGSSSATAESGHPDICAETTPVRFLSVEACGTGSGILHDSGIDLVHLRVKWNVTRWHPSAGGEGSGLTLEPNIGVGMAELQIANDEPGFRFSDAGPSRAETSGAEGVLQLRLLYPVQQGFELIGAAEVGAAYLPHADELATPKPKLLPFAGVSLGFGF